MKRTELKRGTPLRTHCTFKPRKPMKSKLRRLTALERRWQRAVLSLEYCVLCGKFGVQWSHRNEGKGIGMKVSPDQTAALCPTCHHNIDNGNTLSKHDRRSLMDHAIMLTHRLLLLLGRLPTTNKAMT